jgi:hypothetical protein
MASIKLRSLQLKFRKQSSAAPLIQFGAGALFSTLVFEVMKSHFSPKITIWESLALTILFITLSSIWAGYILRKHETLKEKGTTGPILKGQPIGASEAHTRLLGQKRRFLPRGIET